MRGDIHVTVITLLAVRMTCQEKSLVNFQLSCQFEIIYIMIFVHMLYYLHHAFLCVHFPSNVTYGLYMFTSTVFTLLDVRVT